MCRALETIAALDITGALAPLFASQDKRFTAEIQYNIERYGNEESLRQLISILMDNACLLYTSASPEPALTADGHNE